LDKDPLGKSPLDRYSRPTPVTRGAGDDGVADSCRFFFGSALPPQSVSGLPCGRFPRGQFVLRARQIMTKNKAAPSTSPSEPIIVGSTGPPLNVK
jgi:hypothetical protein